MVSPRPCRLVNVFLFYNIFIILLIKSRAHSFKNKHIDLNYQYIQDFRGRSEIKVEFIPLIKMVADPITSGLFVGMADPIT